MPVVTHEINNPLALITNNLYLLGRDLAALREVLALYQEGNAALEAARPDLAQRLRELAERVDLPYTLANPDKLLERSRAGVQRIQQMVRDLQELAQFGDGEAHQVDVNAGVELALRLVQRRAEKRRLTLRKELTAVPALTCRPALISQVVL